MKQPPEPRTHAKPPNLAATLVLSALNAVQVFLATFLVLVCIFLLVGLAVLLAWLGFEGWSWLTARMNPPAWASAPFEWLSPAWWIVIGLLLFLAVAAALPTGVYRQVLTRVYLRRKLTPIFAGAAVALCTAMVIVVISVMGGFLQMMRDSARTLTGEVNVVSYSITGFENYEDLIVELRSEPEISAATPILSVPGLLDLSVPGMADGVIQPIPQVVGIVPAEYGAVCGFGDTLHWKQEDAGKRPGVPHTRKLIENAMSLEPTPESQGLPGIVPGIEVWPWNRRDDKGQYDFRECGVGFRATLTILPLSRKGVMAYEPEVQQFVIFNEFKSGLYEVDENRVFVPFAVLQRMLKMEAREVEDYDPDTGEPTGRMIRVPGRTTEVTVGGAPGVSTEELAQAVQRAVDRFLAARLNAPLLAVETWEQRHQTLLGAVEKEKGLLTVLFAFISIVAVVLVAVIFYMIVSHKIRDIGTLRALGASRAGVAAIFLGYGLAIGAIGAALGAALAWAIVKHLNEIQGMLHHLFGLEIWSPKTYYFDQIPTQMDEVEVSMIIVAAVLSSLLGAVVPAILAARANPVDALRYE